MALVYRGIPLQSAYCGAKHAIEGFTEYIRFELAHDRSRVRVTMVQLPPLNTPQFDWSRSKLPRKARPSRRSTSLRWPPRRIVSAACHLRREVGGSTVMTIAAQRLAPGLLDRYLARTGYGAQQTVESEDPRRDDNLFRPVPIDHGSHGRFDDVAHARSVELWASRHLRALVAGGIAGACVLAGTMGAWRSLSVR